MPPPQTGDPRDRAVAGVGSLMPPPAAEGPPAHRGPHVQAVLPLLLLLLLLAVFQPVDLHGLAGLGLPCISRAVRQSHGCRNNDLPSQGYMVTSLVHPFTMWSQHLWEVCGVRRWGFSLQWADRGMEA